jgi:hypothetical protein
LKVRFNQFLEKLTYHLSRSHQNEIISTPSNFENHHNLRPAKRVSIKSLLPNIEFYIPYIIPPNHDTPPFLKNLGYFGKIYRAQNREMIDMNSDFGLSGESKDRTNPLSSTDIISILEKIPSNSKLHIVFCQSIFDKLSFSSEILKIFESRVHLRYFMFLFFIFSINLMETTPTYRELGNLPYDYDNEIMGVVIFFEIGKNSYNKK